MLLKKNITSVMFGIEEMFDDYILKERQPRSAICKTSDD